MPELARYVSYFLSFSAVFVLRTYPVCAKYHMNITEVPMTLVTRSKNAADFNENARHEVESIIRAEKALRRKLGLAE